MRGADPAGPRPVQLRYETMLTGEGYVRAQAWREAGLGHARRAALHSMYRERKMSSLSFHISTIISTSYMELRKGGRPPPTAR